LEESNWLDGGDVGSYDLCTMELIRKVATTEPAWDFAISACLEEPASPKYMFIHLD
jgi:hypothetical protein